MNSIRQIRELNKRELEQGIPPNASWHSDYRDTAYIYIGGLPFELSEGDVITIFSQFGEPTYINLVRDKETGKSRGFAFLKYEDQRSTDLAVDNLGGAVVMGRTLKVDHTRYKKKDDGEPDEGIDLIAMEEEERRKRRKTEESESESEEERPMIKEERELAKLLKEHDEDDPMKAFLVQEKREEVALALAKVKGGKKKKEERRHRHRHHHRSRKDGESERDRDRDKERDRERDRDSRRSHHRRDRDDREEDRRHRRKDEDRADEKERRDNDRRDQRRGDDRREDDRREGHRRRRSRSRD